MCNCHGSYQCLAHYRGSWEAHCRMWDRHRRSCAGCATSGDAGASSVPTAEVGHQ